MGTFEDAEVGTTTTTRGRTITEADVANFAGVSGDFNHIHTDAEAMAETGYGQRIAHGALIFSVMTGFLWGNRTEEEQDDVVAFYGVDRLRFTAPTFIGDTVHAEFEVVDKEPRDHPEANGLIRYAVEVRNQRDEVVLACETLSLMK
jgi:acyl dehydratase